MRHTAGFVLAALLLSACAALQAEPTSEPLPTLEPTLDVMLATDAPPAPTPTAAPTAVLSIEPFATGKYLQPLGWSPDSQWVTFLRSPTPDGEISLHFTNPSTGEECSDPQFVLAQPADSREFVLASEWQADGSLIIQDAAGFHQGTPCEGEFTLTEQGFVNEDPWLPSETSPDGTYHAATEAVVRDEERLDVTITITEVSTGAVVRVMEYPHRNGLGSLTRGGEWISSSEFLIWSTLDQGPLLVDVEADTIRALLPDVFHVEMSSTPDLSYEVRAVVTDAGYHLLLTGMGAEHLFPDILLYHPESGEVESVGYKGLWGWGPYASPDGYWLLLDAHPDLTSADGSYQFEGYRLMARPIDPAGSETHFVADGSSSRWDPAWEHVAMTAAGRMVGEPEHVSLYRFPDGDLLAVWQTDPYIASPYEWSPDGRYLLLIGNIPETHNQALFIVEP
jgi:hypothetical protein